MIVHLKDVFGLFGRLVVCLGVCLMNSSQERKKVLIVDDEPAIRDSLSLLLKSSFDVESSPDGKHALEQIESFNPDLVLLDVMMPELDGIETLRQMRDRGIEVPVLMLTAVSTVKTAVQAMKFGATDYLSKPFDVTELTSLIVQTLDRYREVGGNALSSSTVTSPEAPVVSADFGCMVGRAPLMLEIFQKISQVAVHDSTILITGESGTGKELVAKELHERSQRSNGPFIAINCAAIPESLIEAELFGHEKGSFTHAFDRRLGQFELADNGTLFLDEIGELSLAMQVKLLRFLQAREFQRIGRPKPIKVNVRVITATNRNLEQMVKEGTFRQDLFYRINVISVDMPSLRDRFEDIPCLIEHFAAKFSLAYGKRKLTFTPEAMSAMIEYSWPGNVRELENSIESLLALAPLDSVRKEDLPAKIARPREDSVTKETQIISVPGVINFEDAERKFETEIIVKALKKTNYVQTRAAELLGISRRILKYKMDKLGITELPDSGQGAA